MRKLILIVVVVAVALAAVAVYLAATTPRVSRNFTLPLAPSQAALLAHVPADAEAFALIPAVARIEHELLANPVTREPVTQWAADHDLPRPWMLGNADAVVWRNRSGIGYALRLDPLRALLVRMWLMFSESTVTADGDVFLVNAQPSAGIGTAVLDDVSRIGAQLPAGDALVVQRESGRGAFPPIGRPAVSSIQVTSQEIVIVSRAETEPRAELTAVRARFPRGAMMAVTFAEPPRILGDFKRIIRADVQALVEDGGSIALYDVDAGTLLPKPEAVIVIPTTDEDRASMADIVSVARLVGATLQTDDELLVAFDRRSLGRYTSESFDDAKWEANRWALRIDPARLVPVLERLGDSAGLRLAAPRIHRGVRDLRGWIRYLSQAKAIEAASSASGPVEELRVRVTSK